MLTLENVTTMMKNDLENSQEACGLPFVILFKASLLDSKIEM